MKPQVIPQHPRPLSESTPLLVGSPAEPKEEDAEVRDSRSSTQKNLPHHLSINENDVPTSRFKNDCLQSFCQALSSGTFRVALGAAFFAATNAAATALYRRNGSTVVSLYIIRSPIIYLANVLLVSTLNQHTTTNNNEGSDHPRQETAIDVLLLRTGSHEASKLALLRSFLNSIKAVLLSVGFVFLTYADAFVIFKGVAVCGTIIVARKLLGGNEKLLPQELLCGIFVAIGILLIAPPTSLSSVFDSESESSPSSSRSLLRRLVEGYQTERILAEDEDDSGPDWVPRQTAGVALVVSAGLLSAFSGTLMRLLSESAGPHKATPSMLLSYLMVLFFIVNGFVAIVIGPLVIGYEADHDGGDPSAWAWTRFIWPQDKIDWALVATNCSCTLAAHLATAAGYQTTRAGIVAFLQLTEIPWVYLLDVLALGESTTTMKSMGSAIVFVSAVAVAIIRQQQR